MAQKQWKIATRYEVTNGRIQLFDKDGNKLPGKGTKWVGNLDCNSRGLTTFEGMPEWVTGNFNCSNNQLTSFEYCPQIIGGYFSCCDNKFTSFKYCPQIIGGHFNCYDGEFTSFEGKPLEYQNMFQPFYNAGYIHADGILTKLISERKKGDVTIYRTQKLASDEIIYVAKQGGITAHAETARKAVEELIFKDANRDVSQYQNMPLDTSHTPKDWAFIYRYITGACETGVKMFLQGKQLKKTYTLEEVLRETKGQYRFERFREITQNNS